MQMYHLIFAPNSNLRWRHHEHGQNSIEDLNEMSHDVRKQSSGVTTRSDTNLPVQSQKQARSLKFRILEEKKVYYRVAKTKVLISFAVTAKLICTFVFA